MKGWQGTNQRQMLIGWREWAMLPDFAIRQIKVKVDTGARTSALHAFKVDTYTENGIAKVRFDLHPNQYNDENVVECIADVIDTRMVTDSGGHTEERPVILTTVVVGSFSWKVEVTLTNRDDMKFRMLLGRTALRKRFIVDSGASYLLGKKLT